MDKILVPDFSNKEPNIESARRKNNAGLCAMHECQNKIAVPEKRFPYGAICEEHARLLEEMLERWRKEEWDEWVGQCIKMYKRVNES